MTDKWYHRRNMTYASLVGGLFFPIGVVIEPELSNISMPFYAFVGATLVSYMGYATTHDKNFKDEK